MEQLALTVFKFNTVAKQFYFGNGFRLTAESPLDEDTDYNYYILCKDVEGAEKTNNE